MLDGCRRAEGAESVLPHGLMVGGGRLSSLFLREPRNRRRGIPLEERGQCVGLVGSISVIAKDFLLRSTLNAPSLQVC